VLKQPVQKWESNIDGNHYDFLCEQEKAFTYKITANGEEHTVKGGFLSMMFGFDEPVVIDDKEMRLMATKSGMDIAYNDSFLISGKKYVPRPFWVWIFAVVNISLVFLAGFLGGAIGFFASALCLSVSRTDFPALMRIGVCTFMTILAWAITLVLAINLGIIQ